MNVIIVSVIEVTCNFVILFIPAQLKLVKLRKNYNVSLHKKDTSYIYLFNL